MSDRTQDVIKAIECCGASWMCPEECPYYGLETVDDSCPMFQDALELLKAREPVRPRVWVPRRQVVAGAAGYYCPVCDTSVVRGDRFCHWCGRELKWDE